MPFERVEETEAVLTRMGAHVEVRRYPGMPHTINQDELDACRAMLEEVIAPRRRGALKLCILSTPKDPSSLARERTRDPSEYLRMGSICWQLQ